MQEKAFMIEMSYEHPVMRQVQFGSLQLPATEYEIRDALQKMRASKDVLAPREYSIYNCEIIPQLNEVRLDSASLDELNFFAKRLISLNEDERNIIKGIATKVIPTDEDEIVSIRDLINMTYGTGIVSVVSNVTNDEQLGEFVIENELQDEIVLVPEGATHLLDKEKIGRIQRAADGGVYVGNLYVCADHFEMPKVYDGITLPEVEPEPWFAFRLLVAEPPQGDEPNVEAAEWITLPMTLKEMREFATRHHVDSITDCVYYDFESSVPQITSEWFTSMEDIKTLNDIAKRMAEMSPEDQVKFKAALEAEKPFGVTLADMEDIASNLDQYEMSTQSDTPGAFFKEYLCKHMDTRFDPEWLDTLMCFREGNELLTKLGACVTEYGVISARGVSLYELVPCNQEQQTDQGEAPSEDPDEDEAMVMKM